MVTDKRPDVPHLAKMPLDFQSPAFERGFAFPKKFIVTMHEKTLAIVLGRVIAEQPQIKEISRARQKFERCEIALVQRTGVGPNPANPILFEQTNDLRPMPTGMTKFDREPKTFRKLDEKFSQRLPAIFRRERGRQLNQDNLKLRFKRFDRAQKRGQLVRA